MDQQRSGGRTNRGWALIGVVILVASSCGGSSSDTTTDAADEPAPSSPSSSEPPSSTEATTSTTTTTTTTTSTTTTTTTTTMPPGPWDPYQDGENDCQKNSDYSVAPMCVPPDIDTVSITRASPLTIVAVFRGAPVGTEWQFTVGFDFDNDATTGINDGIWADFHGIGPDLEFDYFPDFGGEPFAQIHDVAPGPVYTNLEAGPADQGPLGVWTWIDDMTLQLVVAESLVPDDVTGFDVAGQTMSPDYHDPFPDAGQGPLPWP